MAVFRCTKMIRIAKNIKFDEVLKGILEMRKELEDKNEIQKILSVFTSEVCLKDFDEFIEIPEFKIDNEIEVEDNIIMNEDGDGEALLKCKYYLSEKDKKYEDEKLKKSKSLKCDSILKRSKRESRTLGSFCRISESLKTKSCHELSDGENTRRLDYQSSSCGRSMAEQMKLKPPKSLKSQSDIQLVSARSENLINELVTSTIDQACSKVMKSDIENVSNKDNSFNQVQNDEESIQKVYQEEVVSPGGSRVINDSENVSNEAFPTLNEISPGGSNVTKNINFFI